MKRLISFLLCLIILAGCSSNITTPMSPVTESEKSVTITLALPKNSDQITKDTAQFFADEVKSISQGAITIVSKEYDDSFGNLSSGLALVSLDRLSKADSRLNMLTYPFFFDSIEHMSMSLNSPYNLELFEKLFPTCGKAIGALYDGGLNILTNKKFYDELGIETHIVTLQREKCLELFKDLKARQVKIDSFESGYNKLTDKTATAMEISFPQVEQISVEKTKLNLIVTRHYIDASILMLGSDITKTLSSFQISVLTQAFCKTQPYGNKLRLDIEADLVEAAKARGVNVPKESFPIFRQAADSKLYGSINEFGFNNELYYAFRNTGR